MGGGWTLITSPEARLPMKMAQPEMREKLLAVFKDSIEFPAALHRIVVKNNVLDSDGYG